MRSVLALAVLAACSSRAAAPSCALGDLPPLRWPLGGVVSRDWFVTAYMDADRGSGMRDFTGNTGDDAITYDGHDGIDIALARGFEQMDTGVAVAASLDAVVREAVDGEPDRNAGTDGRAEQPRANHVVLVAPNGFTVVYWHLRTGSVAVRAGEHVTVGQKLGEVGSSGVSGGPHLHVGAYDCAGVAIDLMAVRAFVDAPPYHPPHAFRSARYALTDGGAPVTTAAVGATIYGDLEIGATHPGDVVRFIETPPGGPPRVGSTGTGPRFVPGFFWHPQFVVDVPGAWTFTVELGDEVVDQRVFTVR